MKKDFHQPSKCFSAFQYINITSQPLYLFIVFTVNYPSFPFVALQKGVDTATTGFIFASWSLPAFIFPFILPSLLECIGKRKLFLISLCLISLSMGISGFLPLFNKSTFLILAFGIRIIQGGMAAIMNPIFYILGVQLYPQTKDTVFAWQFIAAVMGIGMGPAIGAPIYKFLGFAVVQYIVALMGMLLFLPMAIVGIPSIVDKKVNQDGQKVHETQLVLKQEDNMSLDQPLLKDVEYEQFNIKVKQPTNTKISTEQHKLQVFNLSPRIGARQSPQPTTSKSSHDIPTFASIMSRPRVISGMIAGFSSIMTEVYFTPYLSQYLKQRFNVPEQYHGLYYAIRAFSSALTAVISPTLSKKLGRSNSIWLFYVIIIIAHVFFAQSWALNLPENLYLIVIGLFLMGCSQSQMNIPVVPDLTDYMIEQYKEKEQKKSGNNQVQVPQQYIERCVGIISSLFIFSFGVSQTVGPLMGAILYQKIGYRKAGDAQNLLLILLFVYYSIYGGVTWLKCGKKR